MQCTASLPRGKWAVDLLQYTAALPGGSGQWDSCNALPHRLGAVGSGPPAMQRRTAWGQWALEFLQRTASLPGGVVWCGVVWCGVVWCGVVWCGVVWCAEGAVAVAVALSLPLLGGAHPGGHVGLVGLGLCSERPQPLPCQPA